MTHGRFKIARVLGVGCLTARDVAI